MADATVPVGAASHLVCIEPPTRLAESALWGLQRAFYDRVAVQSWADAIVPTFVSCNAFIASAYARVIMGFIRDWFILHAPAEGDSAAPVYIVETGGGHGKLAFLIVRELLAMRGQWPDPEATSPPFVYVLTDCAASSVAFWETHECLAPLLARGVLNIAVWDAERDTELRLLRAPPSGGPAVVLSPGSPSPNPVVCVANYVFDSLRQEAWRVVEGQLQEGRVSLYSDRAEVLPLPPAADPVDAIRRLKCTWHYSPPGEGEGSAPTPAVSPSLIGPAAAASPALVHEDAILSLVLRAYAARLGSGSVLLPVGGIGAVRRLAALGAGGRCLALVGDKAYAQEDELAGLRDPHVALHGSLSFMANLHASRLAVLASGGMSLHTPFFDGFKVAALLLGGLQHEAAGPGRKVQPPPSPPTTPADLLSVADSALPAGAVAALPDTLLAWADVMDSFGPDNFVTLQRCARDESKGDAASLRLALAVVRLAAWDADVFLKFKANIIDRSPTVSERLAADMARDVAAIAARYFPLQAAKDVSFELGRVSMGLKRYGDALSLFSASQRQCGEHHVSWYNIGICHWYLGDLPSARDAFRESARMRPDYADASNWLVRVEAKLQGDAFAAASTGDGASRVDAPAS